MICSVCGKKMVIRAGKFGQFYGCTGFPKCRHTEKLAPQSTPAASAPTFTPSPYQAAVFEAVQNGEGHLVVEAVAGSGKTTTIVQCLSFTRPDQSVAFVAFNKRIAEELKSRAPAHVHVSTLHSLGYANIRQAWGAVAVDEKKVSKIVKAIIETQFAPEDQERLLDLLHTIVRLVSLAKNTLSADYAQLAEVYCGDLNGAGDAIFAIAARAFEESVADHSVIDYDDMIYYPAVAAVACRRFDWLFVDETQDLNKAQIEFVLRSVCEGGRVVAVGDRYQSIYGFRGADVSAIPNIIAALNAQTLPLSICYRCPRSHVAIAQEIVPQIEAAPAAAEGLVESVTATEMRHIARDGDMVLCRRNAPLVGHAFALIRQGKKAVILGREIATDLVAMVKKMIKKCGDECTMSKFVSVLTAYRTETVARLRAAEKDAQADRIEDQCETILVVAEECETPDQIESRIDRIFSDDRAGVTFASVHKAKGCEADRVFLLKPNELGYSKRVRTPADAQQELNIAYVAYTRAKRELFFVEDDK